MFVKQLTVFIENRPGRLAEVLGVLADGGVSILSMSLSDTTDFGLLRLIVDDAVGGKERLGQEGFSALLSDVSIIRIPHRAGALRELLGAVDAGGVSIEYMYGLSLGGEEAYVVLKASDGEKIEAILEQEGVVTLSCGDLQNI